MRVLQRFANRIAKAMPKSYDGWDPRPLIVNEDAMTQTLTRWPAVWQFQATERHEDLDSSETPDRARWVLALGIVALLVGPLGVFAWMAGNACLKAIADGRMDPTSESNARAGRLLGMIAICMFTFKVTVVFPLVAVFYWWE